MNNQAPVRKFWAKIGQFMLVKAERAMLNAISTWCLKRCLSEIPGNLTRMKGDRSYENKHKAKHALPK